VEVAVGDKCLRGFGRRPGFIARDESEGLMHPGRGVKAKETTNDKIGAIRRKCTSCNRTDMIDLFEERKIQKLLRLPGIREFI
jgi:hypothetical protein